MSKSIIMFLLTALISFGIIVFGFMFVYDQVGNAALTEKTVAGDRIAADGLVVGFRADSNDNLHWVDSFDFQDNKTESLFKRGEMEKTEEISIYEDIRFTGWSVIPYATQLNYAPLENIQDAGIHKYYDEIQERVLDTGVAEGGEIKVKDYLDYYPISFRFQFGSKVYNSDDALIGLKIYDRNGKMQPENTKAYNSVVELYTCFNEIFRIPVLDNEYQKYSIYKTENYDKKTSLGYETEIVRLLNEESDYYEFDPIIVLQEENVLDGVKWEHKDLSGGISYEAGEEEGDFNGKTAADYNLKNRLLFVINNRTAKGEPIDVSQLSEGFGVYELPIKTVPSATVRHGHRSEGLMNPLPLAEQLSMVYPLNEEAEYIEIGLSKDHRYLSAFSVSDNICNVELVDADTWETNGSFKLFNATDSMTYAWGDDGSLAVTNNEDSIAILARKGNDSYEIIYNSEIEKDFIKAFFDIGMIQKDNYYGRYNCCVDSGLAVTVKDGKAALAQNILVGDEEINTRVAALECSIIDDSGLLYWGKLLSDLGDYDYDAKASDLEFIDSTYNEKITELLIEPVKSYNMAEWKG